MPFLDLVAQIYPKTPTPYDQENFVGQCNQFNVSTARGQGLTTRENARENEKGHLES